MTNHEEALQAAQRLMPDRSLVHASYVGSAGKVVRAYLEARAEPCDCESYSNIHWCVVPDAQRLLADFGEA
jgi:hypothetical protein